MSAAEERSPGLAKARSANRPHPIVCRDPRHDGDPGEVGWVNPEGICAECLKTAPRCASPEHRGRWRVGAVLVDALNAEGICTACARAMPSVRKNGERQDNRHGVELEDFPRKDIAIGFGTSRDYLAAFAVAPLAQTMRRVLIFALENTDGPTWVCYRHRGYFLKYLETGKAATRTVLQDLEAEGVLTRHHFKRGDSRLVPGSTEAKEGCSLLEWSLLPGPDLDAALVRAAARSRAREKRSKAWGKAAVLNGCEEIGIDRLNAREEIGIDRLNAREEIGIDLVDRDRASRSEVRRTSICDLSDQDPLLPLDRCLNDLESPPSKLTPTSSLSPPEGDPPIASAEPPEERGPVCALAATPLASAESERIVSPSATRLASGLEAPRSEETSLSDESCGEGEFPCLADASATEDVSFPIASEVGVPDATSADDGAFAPATTSASTPVQILPETHAAIGALVARCQRWTGSKRLPELYPIALTGWCVNQAKRGRAASWLEAFARGVAEGGGEAAGGRASAAAVGVNPFQYATKNPELYVHEGRKLLEAERYGGAERNRPGDALAAAERGHLTREEQIAAMLADEDGAPP